MNSNWIKSQWVIIVSQVTKELSDADDRADQPAGAYLWEGNTEDEVLDDFHAAVPIGCLDDFEISVHQIRNSYKLVGQAKKF
jgi:hypothetical protein